MHTPWTFVCFHATDRWLQAIGTRLELCAARGGWNRWGWLFYLVERRSFWRTSQHARNWTRTLFNFFCIDITGQASESTECFKIQLPYFTGTISSSPPQKNKWNFIHYQFICSRLWLWMDGLKSYYEDNDGLLQNKSMIRAMMVCNKINLRYRQWWFVTK